MREKLEAQRRLVTVWILRASIGLAAFCIVTGLLLFLARGGAYFPRSPSGSIPAILADAFRGMQEQRPSAYFDVGIVVILLTPLARLLSGVVANARVRDWLYVGIGVVVIGLVLTGLLTGAVES